VLAMRFIKQKAVGRLSNDLYCVGWGVKLYSLTHSLSSYEAEVAEKSSVYCLNSNEARILFSSRAPVSRTPGIPGRSHSRELKRRHSRENRNE